MAATRYIEEERGTFTGVVHAHNGYYAGDFRRTTRRPGGFNPHPVAPSPALPFDDWPRRRR
jgi:hypothetical protein